MHRVIKCKVQVQSLGFGVQNSARLRRQLRLACAGKRVCGNAWRVQASVPKPGVCGNAWRVQASVPQPGVCGNAWRVQASVLRPATKLRHLVGILGFETFVFATNFYHPCCYLNMPSFTADGFRVHGLEFRGLGFASKLDIHVCCFHCGLKLPKSMPAVFTAGPGLYNHNCCFHFESKPAKSTSAAFTLCLNLLLRGWAPR